MMLRVRPPVRALVRIVAVAPVLASLMVAGSAAKAGPAAPVCAQAATLHHVALVVDNPGATTVTRCIAFTENSITGDQVLARSGVEYATGYSGQAVCQINYQPATYPATCWTSSSPYWALYGSRGGGAWAFSSLGFTSQTFRDGDAEGFRYEGQSDYSTPPSPAGVCPAPVPPTATPAPTSRPSAAAGTPHPSQQPATRPAGSAPTSVAPASPPALQPASITTPASTVGSTVGAAVAAVRSTPPASPPSVSAGAFAAAGLGVVLLVLLIAQAMGPRRRAARPRSQP